MEIQDIMDMVDVDQTHIEVVFPTTIYMSKMRAPEKTNEKLRKTILDIQKSCEAENRTLPEDYVNGFTTYFFEDMPLQKDPRFKTIMDFIQFSISNYAHSLGYDPNKRKILITWLWASIQFKGGFHVKHFHGGCLFSGTYYIDVPDNAGNIRFYDPKEAARMAEPRPDTRNRMNVLELNVKPENGKIVIFPAYLQHDVKVHLQEKPRFSVSFNAILDEKLGS